ncbi:gamma carbonic anhydrase family protein [Altericroceibacterium endophyticum]|uniref:Gamma carbonic anhydrase family protein n=1 Tax=Altericroceibacterium endophyticum TaxID=1808508 RepID=A0A6I4TAA2_9SPHN|nr:gamma carbonic anhydrase family protein [Altericroceibacterium endophyticum]MXO67101.1 gamma carbonic anhydrase family protein [Altericroceibacterium endophyticum]
MTRHSEQHIHPYLGRTPAIHPSAFIAPGAQIIGNVEIGPEASIWYNCVLRADIGRIVIGARSNVQDGTVIHVEAPREGQQGHVLNTIIGADALVGHMAILHGCTVEDRGFVGMGAIVMDGARISSEAMLAAGALLAPGKTIPPGEIWAGRPAKPMRSLSGVERAALADQTAHYLDLASNHARSLDEQQR